METYYTIIVTKVYPEEEADGLVAPFIVFDDSGEDPFITSDKEVALNYMERLEEDHPEAEYSLGIVTF